MWKPDIYSLAASESWPRERKMLRQQVPVTEPRGFSGGAGSQALRPESALQGGKRARCCVNATSHGHRKDAERT